METKHHTHIEIGTTLVGPGDNRGSRHYRVVNETRLSWKVREVWPSGELNPTIISVNKETMVDRSADGRGYSRQPFITLATFERQQEERRLRSTIVKRLDGCRLEVLREIDQLTTAHNGG